MPVLIAVAQPVAKGREILGAIGKNRVVATELVVDLPAGNRLVGAVALGECGRDALALHPPGPRREAAVAPAAEAAGAAVRIGGQDVGFGIDQPFRRRRGGRAEHDAQAGTAEHVERAVEPAELELSWRGLDARPGELADADKGDAGFTHGGRIDRPLRLRPMFRVVADAEHQQILRGR